MTTPTTSMKTKTKTTAVAVFDDNNNNNNISDNNNRGNNEAKAAVMAKATNIGVLHTLDLFASRVLPHACMYVFSNITTLHSYIIYTYAKQASKQVSQPASTQWRKDTQRGRKIESVSEHITHAAYAAAAVASYSYVFHHFTSFVR